mmetsp:Transcript_39157/g.59725  ORF Transcript_39157/g.59725 Transcript_39157/m.59725 type:complete len:149 (+) Transcript_39157:3826-4272(+)
MLKSSQKNLHAFTSRNEHLHVSVKVHNPEVIERDQNPSSSMLLEPSPKAMFAMRGGDSENMSEMSQREMKLLENIKGDSRRFLQIIMNFLSNSLKFTSNEGNITVKLSLLEVQKKTEKSSEERLRAQRILTEGDTIRSQTMKSIGHGK